MTRPFPSLCLFLTLTFLLFFFFFFNFRKSPALDKTERFWPSTTFHWRMGSRKDLDPVESLNRRSANWDFYSPNTHTHTHTHTHKHTNTHTHTHIPPVKDPCQHYPLLPNKAKLYSGYASAVRDLRSFPQRMHVTCTWRHPPAQVLRSVASRTDVRWSFLPSVRSAPLPQTTSYPAPFDDYHWGRRSELPKSNQTQTTVAINWWMNELNEVIDVSVRYVLAASTVTAQSAQGKDLLHAPRTCQRFLQRCLLCIQMMQQWNAPSPLPRRYRLKQHKHKEKGEERRRRQSQTTTFSRKERERERERERDRDRDRERERERERFFHK